MGASETGIVKSVGRQISWHKDHLWGEAWIPGKGVSPPSMEAQNLPPGSTCQQVPDASESAGQHVHFAGSGALVPESLIL